MKITEIKNKSMVGAKWTIILSTLAIPLSYMTNIVIGRISNEALGIYAFINIFISFVITFVLIGGNNVIVKFLPELKNKEKNHFLLNYFLIILLISILSILVLCFYPNSLEIVLGQSYPANIVPYLILFIPFIILYSVFDYTLVGLLEIKASTIIKQISVYGTFIIFSILLLFFPKIMTSDPWFMILIVILIFYILMTIMAFHIVYNKIINQKKNNRPTNKEIFQYPPGFWRYLIFVHISTILVFFYDKIDQLFIIGNLSVADLGVYYAALQTATLIRYIPMLIGNVSLPTFSNIFASDEKSLIPTVYKKIIKYTTLMTVFCSLGAIFYSKEIMGIFGSGYVVDHSILVILGFFFMPTSVGAILPSLILSKGKAGQYLINSIIQVSFQIGIILLLFNSLGVIGLAIGRGAGVIIAQVGLIIISYKILGDLKTTIPRNYLASIVVTFLSLGFYYWISDGGIIFSTISFFVCLLSFMFIGKYSKKDIMFIINSFKGV